MLPRAKQHQNRTTGDASDSDWINKQPNQRLYGLPETQVSQPLRSLDNFDFITIFKYLH